MGKICSKCNTEKEYDEFYIHKGMGDGYLSACKECIKLAVKNRFNEKMKDPEFHKSEKKRAREKYYRLDYKTKHKPTAEYKKESMRRHRELYPEKFKARNAMNKSVSTPIGFHYHHWSYNTEHWVDTILIDNDTHSKLHRYIIYDQERMMYRTTKSGVLLNTKEFHLEYLELVKALKE